QLFAAHGYAVVTVNPRGSSGYGEAFSRAIWADWGNKDYDDVMAGVDYAIRSGIADPRRLGVGGWSYGGILTDHVIVKTNRFAAAAPRSSSPTANRTGCAPRPTSRIAWSAPWRGTTAS